LYIFNNIFEVATYEFNVNIINFKNPNMTENFTKFLINRYVLINFFVYFYIRIMAFEIDYEFELQIFK